MMKMDFKERINRYNATRTVRELARQRIITVDRSVRKNPEWKEYLLPLVSDEFIIRQLQCIQPYCCIGWSKEIVEFMISYYYFPMYIKVKLSTKKVISFHYSVDSSRCKLQLEKMYISHRESDGLDVCDIVIMPEAHKSILEICLGSEMLRYDAPILMSEIGKPALRIQDIEFIVNEFKGMYLKRVLTRIVPELTTRMAKKVRKLIKSLNILSYSSENEMIKLISVCYDFYLEDPANSLWLKDSINGFLLTLEPETLNRFIKHLPNLLPNNSVVFREI